MEFLIKALDGGQGVIVYALQAQDESDARRQVDGQGRRLISISASGSLRTPRAQKVPLLQFSEELVALLEAGLNLVEAIDALVEKEGNPAVRRTLQQVRMRLFEGATLSTALSQLPQSFPPLYVAVVKSSERSGAIAEALRRFIVYQRQLETLRAKLISASIYPAVLCGAGLLVTFFLMGYVVPRFSSIYQDMGGELPWASRMLMQWGRIVSQHGSALLTTAVGGTAALIYALSRAATRAWLAAQLLRIPAIGEQFRIYQLARMYRTVGMLLRGGIPAVTALQMSSGMLGPALQAAYQRATQAIREGTSVTTAMETNLLTTPVAVRMLRVGEHSGNLGDMMERIAAFYDEQMARAVDLLTRLIEPALMTVIGLLIGLIVVLMYFPIFELAGSLQ
jgi:general secretion pathway protein F